MRKYSFIFEADQINLENPPENNGFEPLIKSKADIPLSTDQAKKMEVIAKIRQIEAETKKIEKETEMSGQDPNAAIDPMTGMPMDPNAAGGQIDPMTGMPMDPNAAGDQQDDPLKGLGDKSAPPDPMGGMGSIDPMTGMPMDQGPTTVYTAIGRAYKLKDIFNKLNKIRKYLRDCTNTELSEYYDDAQKSFSMFKLMVNNLKIYKDKVDDLIIMYYELLKTLTEKIKNTLNETDNSIED